MPNVNFPEFINVCDQMDHAESRLKDATIARLRAMLENNNDAIQEADHREDAIRGHIEHLRGLLAYRLDHVGVHPRNGLILKTGNCVRALSRAIEQQGPGGNFRYRVGRSASVLNSEAIYRQALEWNIPVPLWDERSNFIMDVITNHNGIPIVFQQIEYGG